DGLNNNDPFTLVLDRIYIPQRVSERADIGVLVDVQADPTKDAENSAKPCLVYRQRGVNAETFLSLQSLRVYSLARWRQENPPYIHVQVLQIRDLQKE